MPREKRDIKGEEVERYKLTPEQLSFQKRFALLKNIQKLLEGRSLALALQTENERGLWERLNSEFSKLQPPARSINELPGMNFGQEQDQEQQPGWNLKY
jgi:hypothetical protein